MTAILKEIGACTFVMAMSRAGKEQKIGNRNRGGRFGTSTTVFRRSLPTRVCEARCTCGRRVVSVWAA